MKVSFYGSTNFSLQILKALHQKEMEGKLQLLYVVSQPAAPFGRKKELKHNPVAQYALDNNLPLLTPTKIKDLEKIKDYKEKIFNGEQISSFEDLSTDITIVAAYGKILPTKILNTAKYGFLNFHGSILPKYRGAIPVQMTIMNQDGVGGITVIKMKEGMDTGEIIKKEEIEITSDMTSKDLMEKLAEVSEKLIDENFDLLFNPQKWHLEVQDDSFASVCYVSEFIKKKLEINYLDGVKLAHGKVMAANPEPKAWIDTETLNLKMPFFKANILRTKFREELIDQSVYKFKMNYQLSFHIEKEEKKLFLELSDGLLEIIEIQPEGKKVMDSGSFINGYKGYLS